MGFSYDSIVFETPCPRCGKKIVKKPIRWFKRSGVSCPYCRVALNTTKFVAYIDGAQRKYDEASRLFRRALEKGIKL